MSPARKTSPATEPTGPAAADPDGSLSYEQARDELAQVVSTLESGGLDLEESLTVWERGEQLARRCEALLDGAQARVRAVLDRVEDEEPGDPDE